MHVFSIQFAVIGRDRALSASLGRRFFKDWMTVPVHRRFVRTAAYFLLNLEQCTEILKEIDSWKCLRVRKTARGMPNWDKFPDFRLKRILQTFQRVIKSIEFPHRWRWEGESWDDSHWKNGNFVSRFRSLRNKPWFRWTALMPFLIGSSSHEATGVFLVTRIRGHRINPRGGLCKALSLL